MKRTCFIGGLLLLFKLGYTQSVQPFKKGDRVVFAGNSITEAGLYENYIWLYYMTHFPDRELQILNGGVGGDVAGQIYERLPGDILKKDPSVLVVTFGMNDSRYFEYLDTTQTAKVRKEAVDTSYVNFLKIEALLNKYPSLRKIMMSSSPYDETMQNKDNYFKGKSTTLDMIASFQQEACVRNNWEYVDLLHPMLAVTKKEQAKKPDFTLTGSDRIHPGSAGHFVMAYFFLKAQGLDGEVVADVVIDAAEGKAIKSTNVHIKDLKRNEQGIRFDYLAKSLPYPIDTVPRVWQNFQVQKEALEVIPFTAEFNQERMVVSGLKPGNYTMEIDGQWIGNYSAEEWAKGINLAEITHTPQYKQSLHLMELNRRHRELEAKFRNYYWVEYNFLKEKGLLFNDSDVARDTVMNNQDNGWLKAKTTDYEQVRVASSRKKLEEEMQFLRKEMYQLNKPKKRHVTLNRIPDYG